jgi:hypothetical protein
MSEASIRRLEGMISRINCINGLQVWLVLWKLKSRKIILLELPIVFQIIGSIGIIIHSAPGVGFGLFGI